MTLETLELSELLPNLKGEYSTYIHAHTVLPVGSIKIPFKKLSMSCLKARERERSKQQKVTSRLS